MSKMFHIIRPRELAIVVCERHLKAFLEADNYEAFGGKGCQECSEDPDTKDVVLRDTKS